MTGGAQGVYGVNMAQTPRFQLRLPDDMRADLEYQAELERRTLTGMILYVLGEWLATRATNAKTETPPRRLRPGRRRTN